MSDIKEIEQSLNRILYKKRDVTLLQCTSKYPTPPEEIGLNLINKYKKLYKCKVGLSDHSGEIYSMLAAATLGVDMIEFHCVYDKKMFGPDSKSSLNFNQIKELLRGTNYIKTIINNSVEKKITKFKKDRKNFGKSLAVNKDLKKDHKIKISDLETKKPFGFGIDPKLYKDIINRKINKSMKKWDFLTDKDLNSG